MPRRKRLTDAGIARLRPEPREYTVWDTRVRGLGVRVRPSGTRTYIYYPKSATGTRKVSLGPVTLRGIEEVRRSCLAMAAAAVAARETVQDKPPLFREFVAGPWRSACFGRCKPSTQRVMRSALKRQAPRLRAGTGRDAVQNLSLISADGVVLNEELVRQSHA